MKRISKILALVFALVLVLCSCSKNSHTLKIGKGEIKQDIFAYFLDQVYINQGKDKKLSEKDLKQKASEACVEYTKINTKFKDMKLKLPASTKATIATDVTNEWLMYSGYYESIGVSKSTLTKVHESEAYKDELLKAIYSKDGTNPVDEEKVKTYFKDNYIFFKSINAYLKGGADKQAVIDKFNALAGTIGEDTSIDTVNKNYLEEIGQTSVDYLDVAVVNKNDDEIYPAGFFNEVKGMESKAVKTIVSGDYAFVVQKFDNFDKSLKFYDKYKNHCLVKLVEDDFEKKISSWYKSTKATYSEKSQNEVYKLFKEARKIK